MPRYSLTQFVKKAHARVLLQTYGTFTYNSKKKFKHFGKWFKNTGLRYTTLKEENIDAFYQEFKNRFTVHYESIPETVKSPRPFFPRIRRTLPE